MFTVYPVSYTRTFSVNVIIFLIAFSGYNANAQYRDLRDSLPSINADLEYSFKEYTKKLYKPDFSLNFADEEDKLDFAKLRIYYAKKKVIRDMLIDARPKIDFTSEKEIAKYENMIDQLSNRIESRNDTSLMKDVFVSTKNIFFDSDVENITVQMVKNIVIPAIKEEVSVFKENNHMIKILDTNIALINGDIRKCEEQINIALAPEIEKQKFRTRMSLIFSVLIGFLVVAFFFIIYKKSDKTLGTIFLSGYGLQFITLFVLIIAIVLFGILGILQGSELAAILSGISGYILGKGVKVQNAPSN